MADGSKDAHPLGSGAQASGLAASNLAGSSETQLPAFRAVPRTGVIFVTTEATRRGFRFDHPDWCNLGQGQPETGTIPGAPSRVEDVVIRGTDQDYAPVAGLPELRDAVAQLYNETYRRGLPSKYSAENVAICGGGRVGLMRVCATIAPIHLGHFLPDYTAYEEVLDVFRRFQPVPILLDPDQGYEFSEAQLRRDILGRGLGALLMSNPCNPTGKVVGGEELQSWTRASRELDCSLILDEFYSHYVWTEDGPLVSAASYVEDVNRDPVVILDGLTKNWRYPGWRVTWVLGPKEVVENCASAGSFLDGGGSRPLQRAALPLLERGHVEQETKALHACFQAKREVLIEGLKELGIAFELESQGTFYAWGNLSALPPSLQRGRDFFQAALDHKVIVVPGEFFDVDPGKRRLNRPSRFENHVRFSFGPDMSVLEEALRRLRVVVEEAKGTA